MNAEQEERARAFGASLERGRFDESLERHARGCGVLLILGLSAAAGLLLVGWAALWWGSEYMGRWPWQ